MIKLKELLTEGYNTNSKLGDRIAWALKNADHYSIDPKIVSDLTAANFKHSDILQFAGMFERDTFRTSYIQNGKLEALINHRFIPGTEGKEKMLKKAAALHKFMDAMDAADTDWKR